jgi:hypothetical protein
MARTAAKAGRFLIAVHADAETAAPLTLTLRPLRRSR